MCSSATVLAPYSLVGIGALPVTSSFIDVICRVTPVYRFGGSSLCGCVSEIGMNCDVSILCVLTTVSDECNN